MAHFCDRCRRSAGRYFMRTQARRHPVEQPDVYVGREPRWAVTEACVCEDCFSKIRVFAASPPGPDDPGFDLENPGRGAADALY